MAIDACADAMVRGQCRQKVGIMTRSELIELMASQQNQLTTKDVELAVKLMIDHMAESLASGERIEIRGFGSFSLHYREPVSYTHLTLPTTPYV